MTVPVALPELGETEVLISVVLVLTRLSLTSELELPQALSNTTLDAMQVCKIALVVTVLLSKQRLFKFPVSTNFKPRVVHLPLYLLLFRFTYKFPYSRFQRCVFSLDIKTVFCEHLLLFQRTIVMLGLTLTKPARVYCVINVVICVDHNKGLCYG